MELTPAKYDFLGLMTVVASPRMRHTLELASRMARSAATVLIEGESGSGKEVLARAVHHFSSRHNRPWVDVNCAALPEQLMESELFGHERGAFSGADHAKPGLFELAHTGTLFLDEIGELDARMQVKLLRVLDNAPYYRLGGTRKIDVDVRVVAATNVPLEAAVGCGRFRNDLYHRLSMLRILVPPLRERPEDIGALAQHFLDLQGTGKMLSRGALERMGEYRWPGNVRELRNIMLRAAILCDGLVVEPEHLGLPVHDPAALELEPAGTGIAVLPGPAPGAGALEGMERQAILAILNQTRGHRQKAADILGISRRTLSRKLKQYGHPEIESDWGAHPGEWQMEARAHGRTA
jgi:transcriptional regulator with PAS, ATPase and Fis domain